VVFRAAQVSASRRLFRLPLVDLHLACSMDNLACPVQPQVSNGREREHPLRHRLIRTGSLVNPHHLRVLVHQSENPEVRSRQPWLQQQRLVRLHLA